MALSSVEITSMVSRRVPDKIIGHARIIQRLGLDQFRLEVISGPVGKNFILHRKEILVADAVGSEGLLVLRRIGPNAYPHLLPD